MIVLPIIEIDYYHKETRDIQIYKEGTLINGFMNLRKSFDSIKYSLSMIDIIDKTLAKHNHENIIFNLLGNCLLKMSNKYNKKIVFIYFLLLYSHYSGYSIASLNYQSNNIDFSNNMEYDKLEQLIMNYKHDYIIKELIYLIGLNINEIKNVKSLRFLK